MPGELSAAKDDGIDHDAAVGSKAKKKNVAVASKRSIYQHIVSIINDLPKIDSQSQAEKFEENPSFIEGSKPKS